MATIREYVHTFDILLWKNHGVFLYEIPILIFVNSLPTTLSANELMMLGTKKLVNLRVPRCWWFSLCTPSLLGLLNLSDQLSHFLSYLFLGLILNCVYWCIFLLFHRSNNNFFDLVINKAYKCTSCKILRPVKSLFYLHLLCLDPKTVNRVNLWSDIFW